MKVKANDKAGGRRPTKSISIELDDMEAGFLRAFLCNNSLGNNSFADNLVMELAKYRFPAHEERYGDWDKRHERESDD